MSQFENNRLTPVKPEERTDKFATYDIEAQNWNRYLMGGFYDGNQYHFCKTIEELCNTMLKRKYEGWHIYAHYGGGYDHRFILDYILKHRPNLKVQIIENHGVILGLKVYKTVIIKGKETPKNVWHFWDSLQVIKGGLSQLTKIFDVKHKKIELNIDMSKIEDTPETREYLEYDVKGLYEVIEKFYSLPLLQGVSHKMTTSSLALTVFRMRYLKDTILYKLSEEKEEFVRRGYYGGRTEIFKPIAKNVREYDVNSMYVYAMLFPLPCGTKGIWMDSYDFTDPSIVGFLEVEAEAPHDLHVPVLPVRYNDKLVFPVGRFKGVYFSEEIKEALKYGYKIKILRSLIFKAEPFLKQYAEDVWQIRQDNPGSNPLNTTAKLLGNGIYGKFAQERERTMLVKLDFEEGCQNEYTLIFPEFDLWRVPTHSDSPAILPYISAAITAYSRIILHRYLIQYPEKLVYCDTDSIFVEDETFPSSKELGGLKFENHHYRFAAIQPKFYIAEPTRKYKILKTGNVDRMIYKRPEKRKLRVKGFNADTLDWTYEDFHNALVKRDYSLFYQEIPERMTKLNQAILLKDILALSKRVRSCQTEYEKREVNREDWTTKPLILEMEDENGEVEKETCYN